MESYRKILRGLPLDSQGFLWMSYDNRIKTGIPVSQTLNGTGIFTWQKEDTKWSSIGSIYLIFTMTTG